MGESIPALLLRLPSVGIDERHVRDGRVTMSIEDASTAASAYFQLVEDYLQQEQALDIEKDIAPAVDFALRLFNAENFSGELVPAEREELSAVLQRFTMADALLERCVQRLLVSDGEMPHPCLRLSALLLCALAIVCSKAPGGGRPLVPYHSVWRLRVHMRHQLVLQHRAHSVFLHLSACVDAALGLPEAELSVEHLLEVGHVHNYYHRRDTAAETFWRAVRKSGLTISESAMLGVRTRWQQQQLVQMVMNAQSALPFTPRPVTDAPRVVMGEEDGHDLLDRPRESVETPAPPLQPLHPLDKALILALCLDLRNTNPYHGLTQHHMQTYVERLIVDPAPAPFMIQCQTLLLRSRLERRRNRVQERAFMQLTELVDQFTAARDPTRKTFHRTESDYFYSVAYPSIWQLKSEYADFCYEESLFKTALDAYEQVLDWENIIKCCKALDKRKRAESLARELLETDPCNPLLWVALGEATREVSHLWKAWELSNHRSAAPMRALARLALEREEYSKVVEYFDEAVRLNPVFGGDWFSLGYAAMRLEQWDRSGEAFTRVCQIQPNDAYAWNNLASVLLRDGRLRPAFNAMSQALRNNRRDWRMWQNYFSIGCELKEVTETTNALNVLLEIAKRNTRLERESLNRFVDNAIAYMEGRIPASSRDHVEAAEVSHASVALVDDDGAAEAEQHVCDLVPLGSELDMPEAFLGSGNSAAAAAEAERVHAGIVDRYKQRMRDTFKRITDLFVTDPDIYACGAKLLRYMDGPLRAYEMRLKELRCCQQKDQWERDETRFARTCECLHELAADALAAAAIAPTTGSEDREDVQRGAVAALDDTLSNTMAVIEAAQDYMRESADYDKLRSVLLPQLRSGLQKAKSAFNSG
ncbi:tetratricopeptide repeat domain 27 [Trypanosoma conorhini]|uniref:Tetratricopeptide repeat domain 27 n=1 Tax=Trypanosoma conorhini TaxID=83891 RepID=A0A3R7L6S2_9TRYP|nr:tetratricopeptide repeat domain 27 [Trypanosoma conorhini]RNF20923.1 tetratricopeptide repeat domain 27 [Trypanosoma conorhini]